MILKIYLPNKQDKMHFYRLILLKSQENDHFHIIKDFRALQNGTLDNLFYETSEMNLFV